MRLVKALRRGFATLVVASSLIDASCVDERPAAAALVADDCPATLRLPRSPRIVQVNDDGSLLRGPDCASANCLAGVEGAWAYRDDAASHLVIGTGAAARTLELPSRPRSSLAAQHTLTGFVIGRGVAGIDRGADIEIVSATLSQRVPMPPLADGEALRFLLPVDGGLDGITLHPGNPSRRLTILPHRSTPPSEHAVVIADEQGVRVGWFLPATGQRRSSIVTSSGTLLPLARELDAASGASARGGSYLVTDQDQRAWLVSSTGATVATLPGNAQVEAWQGQLYVVDVNPPGGVFVLDAQGLTPLLPHAAGLDISGAPLPVGARVERFEALTHAGRVLLVERVRTRACTVDERLVLIDLPARRALTIASGDVLRLHPTFAGDRFRFVEADVALTVP